MSEERRKRRQAQADAGQARSRKLFLWAGIAALFAAAYAAGWYHNNHRYDSFAKCLAAKQAKMYGLYWCPHCIEEKEKFGKSFRYVPYVECAIQGSRDMAAECKSAGAKNFPSWQFEGGPLQEGVLSLDALSDKTGCSLP